MKIFFYNDGTESMAQHKFDGYVGLFLRGIERPFRCYYKLPVRLPERTELRLRSWFSHVKHICEASVSYHEELYLSMAESQKISKAAYA